MPLRDNHPGIRSKNPIAGYMVCACEDIATLHHFRGDNRQGLYSNCPKCGTSVSKAAEFQARLKAALVPELDQLPESALAALSETDSGTNPQPSDTPTTSDIDLIEVSEINERPGSEPGTVSQAETPQPAEVREPNHNAEASGNEPETNPGNGPTVIKQLARWVLGIGALSACLLGGRAAYIKMFKE